MMIDNKMTEALNGQIYEELNSYYIYLSMSAYLEAKGRNGMASWMLLQAQEEMAHAMKIFKYLQERGVKPVLKAIAEPKSEYASEKAVFEAGYQHELHITSSIYKLIDLARSLGDKATELFLGWYVKEQVEEEDNATTILQKFGFVDGSSNGLYLLDKELGKRGKE